MNALILVNGDLRISPELLQLIHGVDYLIAADGGAKHTSVLKRRPDTLIGDLDSISQELLEDFKTHGVEILQHPVRKNATDLELAIDHALTKGVTEIYFAGMLGGRWDMSFANIFLLAHEKYTDVRLSVLSDEYVMHVLHPGAHSFTTQLGQTISLLPLKDDSNNVTLTGFEYPLEKYTIPFGSSIGMSNVAIKKTVSVKHTSGVLLFMITSKLPE